jgi:lysophospholipase L1-like esterase
MAGNTYIVPVPAEHLHAALGDSTAAGVGAPGGGGRKALPGRPELFSPDGFHPSALGYDVWAGQMLSPVAALLRESAALPA